MSVRSGIQTDEIADFHGQRPHTAATSSTFSQRGPFPSATLALEAIPDGEPEG
jgi:hypothetical protein